MDSSLPNAILALERLESKGRRDFIRLGSIAAALAATGGSFILPTSALAIPEKTFKFIGSEEYPVYKRLMEVMLPTKGTKLVPPQKLPVLQTLDAALLGTLEPHLLEGLRKGVAYFNDGPRVATGKRFVQLDDAKAAAFLDSWADSPEPVHRALLTGLKKLIGLAYWAQPSTWKPLGYDGPVTHKWKLESYGNAPMPQ